MIEMVQMAQKANAKVILGNIVPNNAYCRDHYNGWLLTFAQATNIPIVNFAATFTGTGNWGVNRLGHSSQATTAL